MSKMRHILPQKFESESAYNQLRGLNQEHRPNLCLSVKKTMLDKLNHFEIRIASVQFRFTNFFVFDFEAICVKK